MDPVFEQDVVTEEEKMALDQDALSRQIAVFDFKGSVRITTASVLISGIGPLGVEIAKNLCLAGVKALTIHDSKNVTTMDLGGQFYLAEDQIGQNRAEATLPRLKALNPTVRVNAVATEDVSGLVDGHNVVVLCDMMLDTSLNISEKCRSNGIKLLVADVRGPFAWAFADFGVNFSTYDKDGEPVKEVMLHDISSASEAVVTTVMLDKDRKVHKRHDLEDGDYVTFRDVSGMESLEGCNHKVKVIDPYSFSIATDTTDMGPYQGGATAVQVKVSVPINFSCMSESILLPEFNVPDFFKSAMQWEPMVLHLGMRALGAFQKEHASELPKVWDTADAAEVVAEATRLNGELPAEQQVLSIEEKVNIWRLLSFTARSHLPPLCAAHGGFVAQEVLKAIMQKFTPLQQWFHLGAEEVMPSDVDISSPMLDTSDFMPVGDRTDAQIVCLGKKLTEKLASLQLFMVGAGAIGCELLKNLAMLNVATLDKGGEVTVTDPDIIEKSNLNRQFLFCADDIGNLKSGTAAKAAQTMNPKFNVISRSDKVCPDTQSIYNDEFFGKLACTLNALDNVQARRYVDARSVQLQKPLIDSGTAGTKGHVQVVVPFRTESYGSQDDPPDDSFMVCTIKAFPSEIAHCIQWAKEGFESKFCEAPGEINKLIAGGAAAIKENVESSRNANMLKLLKTTKKYLEQRPKSFADCVKMARFKFDRCFNHRIQQLLHIHPADKMDGDRPFWSLPRRLPTPLVFDSSDSAHCDYILALSMLYSKMFQVEVSTAEKETLVELASSVSVHEFTLKGTEDKKHEFDESLTDEQRKKIQEESVSLDEIGSLTERIVTSLEKEGGLLELHTEEFEKDDDNNFHIAYINAASNLRARSYAIPEVDFFRTKIIAGKIIPAIATTTSLVSALVVIEMIKIVQEKDVVELKNCFLNLGLPMIQLSEPQGPELQSFGNTGTKFSEWDRWEVKLGPVVTLDQLMAHCKEKYGADVQAVFHQGKTVYISSMPMHASRRKKKVHELPGIKVKPDQVPYVDLVVAFTDPSGENIDKNPPVRCHFVE